jgi:hypothetical protein
MSFEHTLKQLDSFRQTLLHNEAAFSADTFQSFLSQVTDHYVNPDNFRVNQTLLTPEFGVFWASLLRIYLKHADELPADAHSAFLTLFKCFTVKSNYRHLKKTLSIVFHEFKIQIQAATPKPYAAHLVNLLSQVLSNPSHLPADRGFFLATNVGEGLLVDLARIRTLKDNMKGLSMFLVFQADFANMDGENYFISKLALTESCVLKLKVANNSLVLGVFKRERVLGEFVVFDKLTEAGRRGSNFLSLSAQFSDQGWMVLLSLNGVYYLQILATDHTDTLSPFRMKLEMFENIALATNCLGICKQFLDKPALEKMRNLFGTNGLGSVESLKKFYDEFAGREAALLTGLSRAKHRGNVYTFRDHRLDKAFQYHGYLNTLSTEPFMVDSLLVSSDVVGKLITLLAFLPEKEQIVRLILCQCKNVHLLRLAAQTVKRDYVAELKAALVSISFASQMTPLLARMLPNLVENETNPYLGQILNNFVINYQVLLLIPNASLVGEYFQHLYICFDRNDTLSDLLDFEAAQKTMLKLFKNTDDENAPYKLAKMAKLIEIVCTHLTDPEALNIGVILSVLSGTTFPQTDNHKTFYRLVLKLIKQNKATPKNKESLNAKLSNFLFQVTDATIIRKTVKLLLFINDANPHPLLLAWRIKFVSGLSMTNVLETYYAYSLTSKRLADCDKLWESLKAYIFEKSLRESSAEFGKWTQSRYTSMALELSLVFDYETLKGALLNLNLSLKQYPKEFVGNVSTNVLFLWIFSILQRSHEERKFEPVYELSLKLINLYAAESIQRRLTVRNFRALFYVAAWYHEAKHKAAPISDAVGALFKSLVQKGVKIDREADLAGFLIILFAFYVQTFSKTEKTPEVCMAWNWVLVFVDKNLNDPAKKGLLPELTKQIGKSFSQPALKMLFFRQGFDTSSANYKTSILHMTIVMAIDICKALVAQNSEIFNKNMSNFMAATFETFYTIVEQQRTTLYVEQVLDLDRFLLELLKFVSAYPMLQGAVTDIVKVLLQTRPKADGFLFKFAGSAIAGNMQADLLRQWIENLAFDGTFELQTREDMERAAAQDIQTCYSEVQSALLQADLSSLKFDDDLELYVSKVHAKVFETQITQKLQKQNLIDSLKVETAIESHALRHSFKKLLRATHEQNRFLYPKELNLKVYRNMPNQMPEFDSERLEGLRYKHRNMLNRELQRPFLKLKAKKVLGIPGGPCDLPVMSCYDRYLQQNNIQYFVATWIKKFSLIGGYLFVDRSGNYINFLVNPGVHPRRKNPIELIEYVPATDRRIFFNWPVSKIYEIHDFKFLQKRTAVEIFFTDSRSEIFHFEDKLTSEQFVRAALKNAASKVPRFTDPGQLFRNNEYQKKWEAERVSNFKYLMLVNAHASRSVGDYSQYPVFPVLVKTIEDNGVNLRDLEKPVGVVGDEKRRDAFIQRLQQYASFNKGPGYNFGSHYSSPAIVLSFLIRLRPYERGCLAIQNGSFDLPDRLFFSIKSTLRNIMQDISDVREFIPEMYYLPAMYLNLNHFDFGKNQSNLRVHDVIVPDLVRNNIFRFIFLMRKLLESEGVSANLGKWIDLIFGVIQNGDRAKKANNVFFHLTYEGCMDYVDTHDPESLEATENQIYHFGQTPIQLFMAKHPSRTEFSTQKNLVNSRLACVFREIVNVEATGKSEKSFFIKKLRSDDFENGHLIFHVKKTLVVVYRFIDANFFNIDNKSYSVKFEEVLPLQKMKAAHFDPAGTDYRIDGVVEIPAPNRIIYGGFLNGKIVMFGLRSQKKLAESHFHPTTVVKLVCPRSDRLISVDEAGLIACSIVDVNNNTIVPYHVLYDFFGKEVRHLTPCGHDSDFFSFYTTKGHFEVRCLRAPEKALFTLPYTVAFKDRTPPHHRSKYQHCLVSFGYIPALVVSNYVGGRCEIVTFSFDGSVISRYTTKDKACRLVSMFVVKDEFFGDHLLAVNEKGDNYLIDLPLMEHDHKISGSGEFNAKLVAPLAPNKSVMMVNKDGVIRIFSV